MIARLSLLTASALLAFAVPSHADEASVPASVGGFVDLEWRAMGMGGHLAHGPGFAAGLSVFDGNLRIGIGGISRPGPWNPATFDVPLAGGASYRGQRRLSLRSDGAMAGLHVALAAAVPHVPWLSVSAPLTVGYGGFGFYMHGDDRRTPDGRRVSEWEDELFGGRDSFLGLVLDAGLRLGFVPPAQPWIRPYIGLYYSAVPGFDTVVRSSYAGVSAAIGVEVALELRSGGRR